MKVHDQDRAIFAEKGVLLLKSLVPKSKTILAKESIFRELERLRVRENGKWHTKKFEDVPPFQVAGKISQGIRHQGAYDDVIPPELLDYVKDLGGIPSFAPESHPQLLVTPPQKAPWSVPHLGWHLDVASPSSDVMPGIQAFVLLDDVVPRGGGTMVITGSHRLHGSKGKDASGVHQTLRTDPVYANLFSQHGGDRTIFLKSHVIRGVNIQVMELCGKAGDVYLMDMRILHAPSVNATKNARLMLTSRYLNEGRT